MLQTNLLLCKFPSYGTIRAHLSTSSLKTLMHCTPGVSYFLFLFSFFSCLSTCWNFKLLYFCICHSCAMWGLAIAALPWVCQCVQLNCIYVTNNTKKNSCSFIFPGNSPTPLRIWSRGQEWNLFSGRQLNLTSRRKCNICLISRIVLLFNFIALLMRANQGSNEC